jgi:hypothetical protein
MWLAHPHSGAIRTMATRGTAQLFAIKRVQSVLVEINFGLNLYGTMF